ncbi:MAG TPA: hypothetical protein VHN99_08565 [Deinococcales bacterium]|nr:hypothetical protein [Deinococcales bacterium]
MGQPLQPRFTNPGRAAGAGPGSRAGEPALNRSGWLDWALADGAVAALDARWQALYRRPPTGAVRENPALNARPEADVVVLGGGLGLLLAAVLQAGGLQAVVVDRDQPGRTHREWNSSLGELAALARLGFDVKAITARTYRTGFVEFADRERGRQPTRVWLPGVLDAPVSSDALLQQARARFLAAGGILRSGEAFERLEVSERGVVAHTSGSQVRARLAVDALGVLSPIAHQLNPRPFDWVCPTVGSSVSGLAGVDPQVGEILVTTGPAEPDGRQYIWELFPQEAGRSAVYLFHYAPLGREGTLADLYRQYFRLLRGYHDDAGAEHLKRLFGFIPSRHRARPGSLPGLVAVGDAAGWNNPLTFTGFGSFVRNLPRVSGLIQAALAAGRTGADVTALISARQANLRPMWAMARFMRPLPGEPGSVNRIVNAFNTATVQAGPALATRFYQDRGTPADLLGLLARMARLYPGVWRHALAQLGPGGLAAFLADLAASGLGGWRRPERDPLRALAARLEREASRPPGSGLNTVAGANPPASSAA